MNISELCIKRPVFATVITLLMLLVGMVASQRLSLREYPAIDYPIINIVTAYPGATAAVVETEITTPLEELMSSLEGVDSVKSTSRTGTSSINITFKPDRDLDSAAADVRDAIARTARLLPQDIETPIIWKQDIDNFPFFWVSITSDQRDRLELTQIADNLIEDRLAVVDGVSRIARWGEREYAMRIWVDRTSLASYDLTTQDIERALRKQNIDIPGGRIEDALVEMSIHNNTGLSEPEEFEKVVIAKKDGYLVRLADVARVEIGSKEARKTSTYNNTTTLALGAQLQSLANPLEVSKNLRKAVDQLKNVLPDDVEVKAIIDSSQFIQASIDNVYTTLFEALVLVIAVIFLFLRSLRAMIIPAVTIPISLITVNALLWWWGFSINTLTLLAMVLGIGIVVDDAIVVMENIHRHIENGKRPMAAAIDGSKEIFFAVVAMTLTLVAVFAPLGFSEGVTGKLFIEFALSLAGAVLISGFTAVTLTPMMCSRMLRAEREIDHTAKWRQPFLRASSSIETFLTYLLTRYISITRKITAKKTFAAIIAIIASIVAVKTTLSLPKELAPYEDIGRFSIFAIAPEGTTIEYGEKHTRQLIDDFQALPSVSGVFVNYGSPVPNMHHIAIMLKDWNHRDQTQFEVNDIVKKLYSQTPGFILFNINRPPLGQSSHSKPIDLLLQSSQPIEELAEAAEKALAKLRENPMLTSLNLDLKLNKPQLEVDIDREKLADAGVDLDDVAHTLETLFSGREVTEFQRGVKKYDVVVQLAKDDSNNPSDLRDIYVRGSDNRLLLLEEVIDIRESNVPRQLDHFNKLRVANITAVPAEGYTLGQALESAIADIESLNIDGLNLDFKGISREYLNSNHQIYQTAFLSIVFIYLVLAAQFESFRDPLIILVAVPFAILGAAIALTLTGSAFSIFTQIGMITLVGLISKHGIMLVDTANRLRIDGANKLDAIIESCSQRFRPILMTTAAMILGAIPLAMADGAGAASRAQLGWTIVGGMLGGTILTLLITPAIYMLISSNTIRNSAE